MRTLRVAFIVAVLGTITVALLPLQLLAIRRGWRLADRLPHFWQRTACRLVGLRVRVEGTPAKSPVLLAANHVSWLDITLLGSILPVSFIAKQEIAGWPVAGLLARLQRTLFIDRTRRLAARPAARAIARRMDEGDVLVLFAEGTTGDGNRLLPFRSALLGAVTPGSSATVQPVALAYVRLGGMPVGMADRPAISWYGDMELTPHFRHLAGLGSIDAVVRFGEPILLGPDSDRKAAAAACQAAVRRMLEEIRLNPSSSKGYAVSIFSEAPKEDKGTGTAAANGKIAAPAE